MEDSWKSIIQGLGYLMQRVQQKEASKNENKRIKFYVPQG